MEREEILLKEYEMRQSYKNYFGTQSWIGLNIFLNVNMALIGGVAYTIIQRNSALPENIVWLILILGLWAILFSQFMRGLYQRNWYLTQQNNKRTRKIENEIRPLTIKKRIYFLDSMFKSKEFHKLPDEIKKESPIFKWWRFLIPWDFPKESEYVFPKTWIIRCFYLQVVVM